jgi:hypothetical protein
VKSAFALSLGVLAVAATVHAGQPTLESRISYSNSVSGDMFLHQGQVRSSALACERGRRVDLFGEGFEEPFDSTRTDPNGRYLFSMKQDGIASDYYTRVRRAEKPAAICKAAESKHKPLG